MPYCWRIPLPPGWSSGGLPPLLTSSWARNTSSQLQREYLQKEGDSRSQEGLQYTEDWTLSPQDMPYDRNDGSSSSAYDPCVMAAQLSLLSMATEPCPNLCRPPDMQKTPFWFPDLGWTTASWSAAERALGVNWDTGRVTQDLVRWELRGRGSRVQAVSGRLRLGSEGTTVGLRQEGLEENREMGGGVSVGEAKKQRKTT